MLTIRGTPHRTTVPRLPRTQQLHGCSLKLDILLSYDVLLVLLCFHQVEDAPKEPFLELDSIGEDTKDGQHQHSAAPHQDSAASSPPTGNGAPSLLPSHFRNPDIPRYLRYGVPLFFALTFGLLLASDLGSGVAAYRQLTNPLDPSQNSEALILQASVFTSIGKLWGTGSYALTILIVIASVSWPFVKILLSLYAWMVPFGNAPRRRERLLEVIDALGKWSFVDVVVFTEIVVAFRSTVLLGGSVVVEIYLVPRWGLFGFVTANMLALVRARRASNTLWSDCRPQTRS